MHKLAKGLLRKPWRVVRHIAGVPGRSGSSSIKRDDVSQLSNVEYNRHLWSRYSRGWSETSVYIENRDIGEAERATYLRYLGDEWGTVSDVEKIIGEYIYPFLGTDAIAAEIGCGGGRIARQVVERTKALYCMDISSEMLERTKDVLADYGNVHYVLLAEPRFPRELAGKLDFVYAFDVFVHLDLHTMWKYFNEIKIALKEGGKAFIHTTNLKAPGGWDRFSSQEEYRVEGHYFVSPEMVDILAQRSQMRIVKASTPHPGNFYLNRDYLVVLEK